MPIMHNQSDVVPVFREARLLALALPCLLLAGVAVAQYQDPPLSDNAHARLLAEGFLANHEALLFYECKIRIRHGYCETAQEALRNGPVHDVVVAHATWLVDGEKVAYERKWEKRFEDKPPVTLTPGGDGIVVRSAPEGVLADEKMSLSVSFFDFGANVNLRDSRPPLGNVTEPVWTSGHIVTRGPEGTFGAFAVDMLKYGLKLRIGDPTEIQGRPTTPVQCEDQDVLITWFIDESRGFIPLETRYTHKGKLISKAYITDIRKCSGDRWFPTRCVALWDIGDNTRRYHVKEFVVTGLDVEKRPDPSAFFLTLPAGMRISDGEKPGAQIKLGADEVVHLNDLEDLYQRTQDMRLERQGLRPADSSRWTLTLALGLGAVIAVIAVSAFLYWRKNA